MKIGDYIGHPNVHKNEVLLWFSWLLIGSCPMMLMFLLLSSLLLISVLVKMHIFFWLLKRNLLEISNLGGVLLLANFWVGSDRVSSDSTSLNICQIGYELEFKWVAKLITVTVIIDWHGWVKSSITCIFFFTNKKFK